MKVFYSIIKPQVRKFLLVVLFNNNGFSQINLVPNPSFEVYDTCPVAWGGGKYVGQSLGFSLIIQIHRGVEVAQIFFIPALVQFQITGTVTSYREQEMATPMLGYMLKTKICTENIWKWN